MLITPNMRHLTDSHIGPMTSQLHIYTYIPVFLPTLYPIIVGCVPSIPPFDSQPQEMSNPEVSLQRFFVPSFVVQPFVNWKITICLTGKSSNHDVYTLVRNKLSKGIPQVNLISKLLMCSWWFNILRHQFKVTCIEFHELTWNPHLFMVKPACCLTPFKVSHDLALSAEDLHGSLRAR